MLGRYLKLVIMSKLMHYRLPNQLLILFMSTSLSIPPKEALSRVKHYLVNLQQALCATFESLDGVGRFIDDPWERERGGGGISRILTKGQVFEKAGVNFSHIFGEQLPNAASQNRSELNHTHFDALGVSSVIHPHNPYVPTTHANVRFFMATHEEQVHWWFGGGWDLTPYYGYDDDCRHWHQTAEAACKPFGAHLYPHFKAWCDRYFYLQHRQEARGIGGLFFDDYNEQGFEHAFNLMQSIGNHFIKAYAPVVERRKNTPFGAREKDFQRYRRGRYVEFNLIYDRGTLFGLQSGGRTESILMSLPPEVDWRYNWKPEEGSPEERLYTHFLPANDWINATSL